MAGLRFWVQGQPILYATLDMSKLFDQRKNKREKKPIQNSLKRGGKLGFFGRRNLEGKSKCFFVFLLCFLFSSSSSSSMADEKNAEVISTEIQKLDLVKGFLSDLSRAAKNTPSQTRNPHFPFSCEDINAAPASPPRKTRISAACFHSQTPYFCSLLIRKALQLFCTRSPGATTTRCDAVGCESHFLESLNLRFVDGSCSKGHMRRVYMGKGSAATLWCNGYSILFPRIV